MNLRLLLTILLFAPFVTHLQSQDTAEKTIFTNAGQIYVAAKIGANTMESENVVMNIEGSALFCTPKDKAGLEIKDGAIVMENFSGVALTGDWVVDETGTTKGAVSGVKIDPNDVKTKQGFILFNNSTATADAAIAALKIADVATGLNKMQYIKFKSLEESATIKYADKPYISMPNILVAEHSHVLVAPTTLLSVGNNLSSTVPNEGVIKVGGAGLFTVEAKTSTQPNLAWGSTQGAHGQIDVPNLYYKTIELAAYSSIPAVKGQVRYAMSFFDKTQQVSQLGGKLRYLVPFSSPYSKLGTDYMLFNMLSMPASWHLGGATGPVVDHKDIIQPGYGYLIAQNVSAFDYTVIEANAPGTSRTSRAMNGTYDFNREYFLNAKTAFSQHARASDVHKAEVFPDLTKADIEVELTYAGLNFVANPYMLPLDLNDILIGPDNSSVDLDTDWGANLSVGGFVNPAKPTIRNLFWVPHTGSVEAIPHNGRTFYKYKMNYFDSKKTGGTVVAGANIVGPLQVFVLQVSRPTRIKIPLSKTNKAFTENKPIPRTASETNRRVDEILLQTEVLAPITAETQEDRKIEMMDRVSLVLRSNGTLTFNEQTDNLKNVVNSTEERGKDNTRMFGSTEFKAYAGTETPVNSFAGLIYTKAIGGVPLITNVVPSTVKQIPVYFNPTSEERQVRLTTHRMETLESVDKVYLIDMYEDGWDKPIPLTAETEYVFTSRPLPAELANENRFILYFGNDFEEPSTIEEESPIIYYNTPIVYIKKLIEKDLGSKVQIYDMLGNLIGNTTITNIPDITYSKPLALGAYIVKIVGKRNYTSKIIVTPN